MEGIGPNRFEEGQKVDVLRKTEERKEDGRERRRMSNDESLSHVV